MSSFYGANKLRSERVGMKTISNETLIKEVKILVKKGELTRKAVQFVFWKHHLYDPGRFGRICREIDNEDKFTPDSPPPLVSPEISKKESRFWWQSGNMA